MLFIIMKNPLNSDFFFLKMSIHVPWQSQCLCFFICYIITFICYTIAKTKTERNLNSIENWNFFPQATATDIVKTILCKKHKIILK